MGSRTFVLAVGGSEASERVFARLAEAGGASAAEGAAYFSTDGAERGHLVEAIEQIMDESGILCTERLEGDVQERVRVPSVTRRAA